MHLFEQQLGSSLDIPVTGDDKTMRLKCVAPDLHVFVALEYTFVETGYFGFGDLRFHASMPWVIQIGNQSLRLYIHTIAFICIVFVCLLISELLH